jgi:hypothetical protein
MGRDDQEANGSPCLAVNRIRVRQGYLRVESLLGAADQNAKEETVTAGDEMEQQPATTGRHQKLSATARKDLLTELAREIGDHAVVDGDTVIVEHGEPVALYCHVEPDGTFVLTWWRTAAASTGHHRWREAAAGLTGDGEEIYASALGGSFLVEVEHHAASSREAATLARSVEPAERIQTLATVYPEAVAALPSEPTPEFLLPDREIS